MTDETQLTPLPAFNPTLNSFRAEEFLALTQTLLAFPLEHPAAALDAAPFRLTRPEARAETPLPPLPPRWYPRPAAEVIEAARGWLTAPPRPPVFEGRTQELMRVLRPLLSGHAVQVRGEPGAGKTTLLAHIANHERTRQRFRRIWWIDQPARLDQTLALALNLPHVLADPDPISRRARLAGQLDEHTLMIIDNLSADDPLIAALPGLTEHVLIAIETPPAVPDPDLPPPEDPEGVVTLHGLDDNAGVDALARHAGLDDIRRVRGQLLNLVTLLNHHPYALLLAGALARRDNLSLDDLEPLLHVDAAPPTPDPDDESDESADNNVESPPAVNASLNRALDVSLEALPRDYRRLVEAFGVFPPDGAPLEALHAVAPVGSLLATKRGLLMLEQYGFVRRDHRLPDVYIMHPVAYERAVTAAAANDGQTKFAKKMLAWALRYAREHLDTPLRLYHYDACLMYARAWALDHAPASVIMPLNDALHGYLSEYTPGATQNSPALSGPRAEAAHLTELGLQMTDRQAFYTAEDALNQALELRQQHDSPHAIAETLVALGRLCDTAGRYEEAVEKLVKAAELVYHLGAESSLSVVRRGLARVYRHLGRLNEALAVLDDAPEAHFERALILRAQGNYSAAVQEMALSEEDAPHVRAEVYLMAGQYGEALAAIADHDDPGSAHLRAQVYHLSGDIPKAVEGYTQALNCCEGDDLAGAKVQRGLGAALAAQGQRDAARAALDKALSIYRGATTPDALRLGQTQRLLAAVQLVSGDTAAAIKLAREALTQFKKITSPDDAADAYRTLGRALWRTGDHEGALAAFEGEVEQAQGSAERDDPRIGVALHHVADAYRTTGNLDRAIANYRRALTHKSPAVDLDGFLLTQLALYRALTEAERHPAALDVTQEILDLLARLPRFDLGIYGYTQALRARTQQAMERPIRARQSLDEWIKVLAARLEEAISDARPALSVLGLGLAVRSLLAENRAAEALPIAERSLAAAEHEYRHSPAAWAAVRDLGETYLALDRCEEAIITFEPLLEEAVRDHPGQRASYAHTHALVGQGYRKLNNTDLAQSHLRSAFEHEPDDQLKALIEETVAAIQLDLGQPAAATDTLRSGLPLVNRTEHPDVAARMLTTLAHTLGGLNRYAEAIDVYEEALSALRDVAGVSPAHTASVLRSLGQTHEAQGQLPEAARAYRRALNVLEKADSPRLALDILRQLARVTAALGDQTAVQLYEQAREETEKWGNAQELGQVLRELADVHRDGGRLSLAVQNYQAALVHQPKELFARDRAQSLRNLGRAYAQLERFDEARAAWTEALELSHDLPDQSPQEIGLTHHAIGEAYRSQGHFDDAERSYREALHYHPAGTIASAATWRALGQALHAAGRVDDAIEALRKALDTEKAQPQQANSRIVQTLYLLAEAHEDQDDQEAAITRFHEALVYLDRRLQPVAYADTLRILGGLYAECSRYQDAHTAYQEALDIEGHHVPRSEERIGATLQAVADTYRAQGDLQQAAEYYQKVTVYANMARRASEDLKHTLDELDRRRGTLQAAQQSLALLDRNPDSDFKDKALIYTLIAHAYAGLNQPQDSADTINTLLDLLASQRTGLSTDTTQRDYRALAWLAAARQAEQENDLDGARTALASARDSAANATLRWVIQQVGNAVG
jgi:tetratricopeptide (TPR) repeat protein